ncbi:alpha/beta fold hydrolase [Jongsikchunia kroppenstedtii]|uniref:alpha/beta fold hydrolase n=1 Tax=Jongsikchunia kroppenstedtii TaxID=1121721 RepID=UPI00039D508A|nr:alpha/beta hydrolase [Jongsikchunia kroppenstedtii]
MPIRYTFEPESGVLLNVREWGPQDADTTVVLSHCWTLSSGHWEDVAELLSLADQTLRVIAYDHRGHGQSCRLAPTLEELADDLAELIRRRVPRGQAVLAGHSMGGMTVITLAERHSELLRQRVGGVALVATSAGNVLAPLRHWPGFGLLSRLLLAVMRRTRIPAPPFTLEQHDGATGWYSALYDMNRLGHQAAQGYPPAIASTASSMLDHDRYSVLPTLNGIPTIVMVGTRDFLTPPGHARALADGIDGAQLVTYPKASHMLPYERRDEVAGNIAELVKRARSAGAAEVEATAG